MWVQTVMHMSGTRANGDRYPPAWTPFPVEDWEGEHLIRGGVAQRVAAPVPQPPPPMPVPAHAVAPEPAQEPAWDSSPDFALDSAQDFTREPARDSAREPAREPSLTHDVLPPAPSDPKQAWVDYAVSQGLAPDAASRMTKADLQSRYGPRL